MRVCLLGAFGESFAKAEGCNSLELDSRQTPKYRKDSGAATQGMKNKIRTKPHTNYSFLK